MNSIVELQGDPVLASGKAATACADPVRLTVAGVSKYFGAAAAIKDVGFVVRAHEFVAVLGRSGSGKTTLFRCIAGLLKPDSGVIRIDSDDIQNLHGRLRRRIAVVFQQFNLVSRLSALDNVLAGRLGYAPAWRGIIRRFTREDRLFALECLDRVGLLDKALQRADTLSGGQQQRVAIARALCQRPSLIIADEPVASLDPNASTGVLELLREIARSGSVGVICSLHQVHLARSYSDRIVGLSHGNAMIDIATARFDDNAYRRLYASSPYDHS